MSQQIARQITNGMMQPHGKVLRMRYSKQAPSPDAEQMLPTVAVTFRPPEGDEQTRQYGDGAYSVDNEHLQLMAAVGVRPSDYDNNEIDLSDSGVIVPLVYMDEGPQAGWYLAQSIFARGKKVLKAADWNDFGDDSAVTVNIGGIQ